MIIFLIYRSYKLDDAYHWEMVFVDRVAACYLAPLGVALKLLGYAWRRMAQSAPPGPVPEPTASSSMLDNYQRRSAL